MANLRRAVAERLRSLEPEPLTRNFTLAAARTMGEAIGGKASHCRITAHVRTRIFEFPGATFHADREQPHQDLFSSSAVQACVASDLVDYFEWGTRIKHYTISPSLRHEVGITEEKVRSQQKGSTPLYLVVEEWNPLSPVNITMGESCIADEVAMRDGKVEPILIGGREGEQLWLLGPRLMALGRWFPIIESSSA